jgi:hypothetical protein
MRKEFKEIVQRALDEKAKETGKNTKKRERREINK